MKTIKAIFCAFAAVMLMASCSEEEPAAPQDEPTEQNPQTPATPDVPGQEVPNPGTPLVLTAAEKNALDQSAGFATDFFAKVAAGTDEDVVVSPLSAQILLGMVANASGSQLRSELCTLLGTTDIAALNSVSKKYMEGLPVLDPAKSTVRLVNGVWADKHYTVSNDFAAVCEDVFGTRPQSVDFGDPSALELINSWVAKETENLIPRILYERPYGVSLLANVLYFNASWTCAFLKDDTTQKLFQGEKGSRKADMMSRCEDLNYCKSGESTIVCLPYGNRSLEAVFILPPAKQSLTEWLAGDFSAELAAANFESKLVKLSLPRFDIRNHHRLTELLIGMGAESLAKTDELAMFTTAVQGDHNIYQDSRLSVNEEGTEGAAVSYDFMVGSNGEPDQTRPIEVELNRPFVMLVRDTAGEAILFAAAIRN